MKYLIVSGLLTVTLALGCGGDGKAPAVGNDIMMTGSGGTPVGAGGSKNRGGAGEADAGETGGGGGKRNSGGAGGGTTIPETDGGSQGPKVTITSPIALASPNSGPVLVNDGMTVVNDSVTVVCMAAGSRPNGAAIDASSVSLEMFNATGASMKKLSGVLTGINANEYSATFSVAELVGGTGGIPNGKVSFSCTASDSAGHIGKDTVSTFVDHGPTIVRGKPASNSAQPLRGQLLINFSVNASPLAPGDTGAAVAPKPVTLKVDGISIDPGTPDVNGQYSLTVSLDDPAVFPVTPSLSVPIEISAKDVRNPTAGVRKDTYFFVVDSQGPDISITSPTPGGIIGKTVSLVFVVTDQPSGGAGVDPHSVSVQVGGGDVHYYGVEALWTELNGTYTFSLDSTALAGLAQITVNIRASDLAGNASAGASASYHIDNKPPALDLDPGAVREGSMVNGAIVCSDPFDPLGPKPVPPNGPNGSAVNDLDVIAPSAVFRALAWDETNSAQGALVEYFSGVDRNSVRLFVQPDPSKGLLVDLNGDGICDDIDPALLTTLPFQKMYPVAPTGTSISTGTQGTYQYDTDPSHTCAAASVNRPDTLCGKTSDLTRVIGHSELPSGSAPEPVVYTLQNTGVCLGDDWQLAPAIVTTNGWICLAVRGSDGVPNFSVSRPLRACMYNEDLPEPDCAKMMSTTPPSCTDGCTPPPQVNKPYIRLY